MMEYQQGATEPRARQEAYMFDKTSTGHTVASHQVTSDTIVNPSPSTTPHELPGKKNGMGSFKIGIQKFFTLLWKNYLLRRRAWSSLIGGFVFVVVFALFTMYVDIVKVSSGTRRNSTEPKNISQDEIIEIFVEKFGGREILFVAEDEAKAREIFDKIDEKIRSLLALLNRNKITWTRIVSEHELLNEYNDMFADKRLLFEGAIVFETLNETEVSYKIRLAWDQGVIVPGSSSEKVFVHSVTGTLFLKHSSPGPNQAHEIAYLEAGFLGLQILIDNCAVEAFRRTRLKPVTLKTFPYPEYDDDLDAELVRATSVKMWFIGNIILFILLNSNEFLVKQAGFEKETTLRELLKVRGYPGWLQRLSWYLFPSLVVDILTFILLLCLYSFIKVHEDMAFLEGSDISLWLVVLMLAEISNNAFLYFISSLIKSTTIATGVSTGGMLFFGIGLLLVIIFAPESFALLLGISIVPVGCLMVALKFLLTVNGIDKGATWDSLGKSLPNAPGMSLKLVVLLFVVETVFYHWLALYFDNILSFNTGIPKPWYYPCHPFLSPGKRRKKRMIAPSSNGELVESKPGFEPHDSAKAVGVDVRSLVATVDGGKIVVNGVTMKMYEGEIFALLGHNGAGKTTLISMLTGMFSPTSGTAMISGYDITKDMDKVRKSLGLCPQSDLLYEKLTVMEHLMLFGQIRGESSSKVEQEAKELLRVLKLDEKEYTLVSEISGGQKRKLCLAMALIGSAKVVILDEPTSGMDPEARRAVWDVLLKLREQRTILLTTQQMEEADVLGDRIGIMAEGQLQCCGSPTFLKSFYGMGYTLKMGLLPGADKHAIQTLIQRHISNATLKPISIPNEAFITLPTETTNSTALTSLFSALMAKKEEMHIESLGLSVASMDEIFVKVGELVDKAAEFEHQTSAPEPGASVQNHPHHHHKHQHDHHSQKSSTTQEIVQHSAAAIPPSVAAAPSKPIPVKSKGSTTKLVAVQTLAILIKLFIYTKRRIGYFLFQLIFPAFMMIGVVVPANFALEPFVSLDPPLEITLDSYKNPVTFYSDIQNQAPNADKVIGPSGMQVSSVEDALWQAAKSDISSFRDNHIVAAEITPQNEYIAWFNTVPLHAAPLAINLVSNIQGKELNRPMKFQMTNYPLRTRENRMILHVLRIEKELTRLLGVMGFCFVLAVFPVSMFFVIVPTEERLNKSKHLQLMTGIDPLNFWVITFLWDLLIFLAIGAVIISVLGIFETFRFFSSHGGLGITFVLILSFAYAVIPFAYVVSHIPTTVAGGMTVFNMFFTIICTTTHNHYCATYNDVLIHLLTSLISPTAASWVRRFSLFDATENCFEQVMGILAKNVKCNFLGRREMELLCSSAASGSGTDRQKLKGCCKNCKDLTGVSCFKPQPFLTWTDVRNKSEPGIGQLLLCLLVFSVACQVIHVFIELGGWRFIRSLMIRAKESDFEDQVDDQDVRDEKERVTQMIMNGNTSSNVLIIDNLCKHYGSLSAVSKLTFGVHHGECFGLLGANGAGKSTTFQIITGDRIQSLGNAYVGRFTLTKDRRNFISNIGYCPQSDAFIPHLTGKENLKLFARLRGVPWGQVNSVADQWLEKIGLKEKGNDICKKYSGGMKRRLSAAIALIGDPALILLDEPTTGVDPVSRRQFWKVLESVKGSGQSIILTSHSMDECETLCSRLGIMVNGQLQCIGGVQHLKHRFAQGYTLTLRLKKSNAGQNELDRLSREISEKFHPCTLKEGNETVMEYQIENTSIGWDVLYKTLEDLKRSYEEIIEDYSVRETSLEEVFLTFSSKQYPPRDSKVALWKRILTCQC